MLSRYAGTLPRFCAWTVRQSRRRVRAINRLTIAISGRHAEGATYLSGRWLVEQESARSEAPGAAMAIRYTAKDVNLVHRTAGGGKRARLEISLDDSQRAGDRREIRG